MLYLAWFQLACTLIAVSRTIVGSHHITKLAKIPWDRSRTDSSWPKVSIVVAARNEEREVEAAIRSLLAIRYANLELIAVNDRSTDTTGKILDSVSDEFPTLKVVHIEDLPNGWLGKNHALQRGAREATGEFILFTDADVMFDPTALKRAVTYAESKQLDHLAATPQTLMPSNLLNSFATTFTICFLTYFPPWQARNPKSQTAIGIGAFNLVRRRAYELVGGHESIRMRPDDDVKLGKILKLSGCKPDIVNGKGIIQVPWYHSVREAIVGLEKNTFSGVDYSIITTIVGSFALLMLSVFPFVALSFTSELTWWLYALNCGMLLCSAAWVTQIVGVPMRCCVLHPISVCLIIFIMWRTMILTFLNDGIYWRETHYRLADLRANRV